VPFQHSPNWEGGAPPSPFLRSRQAPAAGNPSPAPALPLHVADRCRKPPMTPQERQIIESLFARLRRVEQHSPSREPEAERLIHHLLQAHSGAAYYLAQTVVAQERALEAAQARITELERDVYSRGSGGFLSGRSHSHRSSPHQSYRAGAGAAVPT